MRRVPTILQTSTLLQNSYADMPWIDAMLSAPAEVSELRVLP